MYHCPTALIGCAGILVSLEDPPLGGLHGSLIAGDKWCDLLVLAAGTVLYTAEAIIHNLHTFITAIGGEGLRCDVFLPANLPYYTWVGM